MLFISSQRQLGPLFSAQPSSFSQGILAMPTKFK
jgi:hypothetical protein